jgi:prepilin-type N-terminal cleavage/methylation domain-containing protein
MKRYTKGFTLIELLVVIAIIGILASVVLVSLQSARKKGNDARVLSGVQQLRTALEADYNGSNYASSFVTTANDVYTFKTASGPYSALTADIISNGFSGAAYGQTAAAAVVNVASTDTSGLIVITNGDAAAGDSWTTAPTAYAIYGRLPSSGAAAAATSKFFCIDSTGGTNPSKSVTAGNFPITCN